MPSKADTPLTTTYRPELDVSRELNEVDAAYYQSLIGILRWMVELGQVDVCLKVSMMSSHLALPREGHLEQVLHIFAYLKKYHNTELVYDPNEKAMYGKLMTTQSEEEEEVKCNVALCANDSVSLEKKRRQLNETTPNEYIHDMSQTDISLNENSTGNTFNNVATVVQGPTDDDVKNELQKAWTMEMLMNDGNISMTMTNGLEQVSEDYKKFLYARATHSNHAI